MTGYDHRVTTLFAQAIARGVGIGARGESVESYADLAREYGDKLDRLDATGEIVARLNDAVYGDRTLGGSLDEMILHVAGVATAHGLEADDADRLRAGLNYVVAEMRNLRGPARQETVHEWADRLAPAEGVARWDHVTCPECDGTGEVGHDDEDDDVRIVCPACGGDGG